MAQATTRRVFSAAVGALAGAAAVMAPASAGAQEANPASYSPPVVTEAMRAQELQQLGEARDAAADFAESCPDTRDCVGIVFHIGDDFRAQVDRDVLAYFASNGIDATDENMEKGRKIITEDYLSRYASHYAAEFGKQGIRTEMHSRTDYSNNSNLIGSGVSFHVANIIYTTSDNVADIPLSQANAEIPRAAEAVGYAWERLHEQQVVSQLSPGSQLN